MGLLAWALAVHGKETCELAATFCGSGLYGSRGIVELHARLKVDSPVRGGQTTKLGVQGVGHVVSRWS